MKSSVCSVPRDAFVVGALFHAITSIMYIYQLLPSVLVLNSFSVSYHPEKTISHLLVDTLYLRINHGKAYESLQNVFSASRF